MEKKIKIGFALLSLLLFSMLVYGGCTREDVPDPEIIDIATPAVSYPVPEDSISAETEQETEIKAEAETEAEPERKVAEEPEDFSENSDFLFYRQKGSNPFDRYLPMPDECTKMKINGIGGSLGSVFKDLNETHLEAARKIGFEELEKPSDAWQKTKGIVRLESDATMCVDSLTHSVPYLVEEAAAALRQIASAFSDSLKSRGGGNYRIIVTSVLRTPQTVRSLKRRNRNASANSAHVYGTTFDISYRRFAYDGGEPARTQEDLKNLLAEVLYAQRNLNRIYVKHERKQSCFHITAR